MGIHHTHPEILKRLKRAHGHLAKVITMVHEQRSCLDVSQQLYAVEQAISNAKKVFIKDHIDHCFDETIHSDKKKKVNISEFKEITKYL